MVPRTRLFFSSVFLVVSVAMGALPGQAAAQAELFGTFVRYLAIGPDGTMACEECGRRSMIYGEDPDAVPSCDLYFPGRPLETFTLEGTVGASTIRATNTAVMFLPDDIEPEAPPAVTGRSILWHGSATFGATRLAVSQTHEFEIDDRFVRTTVRVTNTGSAAVTELYYMRNGDPDHGICNIDDVYATRNDVRRQPPGDPNALATARAGDGASAERVAVVGIGAHDLRARVHNGGFTNIDASGEWAEPSDGGGVLADEAVDIIFREPLLRPGETAVFEFFYVWGRTEAEVESRFDALGSATAPCVGRTDGDPCVVGGEPGTCHDGGCCTGCFDGRRCVPGSSIAKCGIAGRACESCIDPDLCTADSCTSGRCSNRPIDPGERCDDGRFCTTGERCDARGECTGSGPSPCADELACTMEECIEARDFCQTNSPGACVIDEMCVPQGAVHPSEPCLGCQPEVNPTGWSELVEGTICGDSSCVDGALFVRACNEGGACIGRPGAPCPTGECEDETRCVGSCVDLGCPTGQWCNAETMVCEPARPSGERCSLAEQCLSGFCVDGVCCTSACDGTCERCDDSPGACTSAPEGTDPDDECSLACDGAGACEIPDGGVRPDGGDRFVIVDDGCSCSSGGASAEWAWVLVALALLRRRKAR
jgi:uncharacterized protein (TIGR03382 family)